MATLTVKLKDDKTKDIIRELGKMAETALAAIGLECEGYAKAECPVDTGRLRNSISWATSHKNDAHGSDGSPQATPKENTVYIGSNVEYAVHIEYTDMSHHVGKAHFLRDAAFNHAEHYKEILKAALDAKKV